ncbi:hypothetical protein CHS0354_016540, partial [Potamilus streckersoni]
MRRHEKCTTIATHCGLTLAGTDKSEFPLLEMATITATSATDQRTQNGRFRLLVVDPTRSYTIPGVWSFKIRLLLMFDRPRIDSCLFYKYVCKLIIGIKDKVVTFLTLR